MPITKSAKKSLRVSRTKHAANETQRTTLEKAIRLADAKTINHVVSLIDKAAKTGIIHKNKAARLKSQLAKKISTPKTEKKVLKVEKVSKVSKVAKTVKKTVKAKK